MSQHFSFTRNSYDNCAINKKDQERTAQYNWITDNGRTESKNVCFQSTSPFMQNPFNSIPSKLVDVESDLKGIYFNASKCAIHKFNPNNQIKYTNVVHMCINNDLVPSYTRLNRACKFLPEIDRFDPLIENVQQVEKINTNDYIGINTRLFVRDAYNKAN